MPDNGELHVVFGTGTVGLAITDDLVGSACWGNGPGRKALVRDMFKRPGSSL
jgi:hypothetical protein